MKGHQLEAAWVPGHSDFAPNELADKIAKQAAEESSVVWYPAEKREVVNKLNEMVKVNWQFRVDVKLANHKIAAMNPGVGTWFSPNVDGLHLINQLATGHNRLNNYLSKFVDTTSRYCRCGATEEENHFVYECECYSKLRFEMLTELNHLYDTEHKTLKSFSWRILMGQDKTVNKQVREQTVKSFINFVKKTRRFEQKSANV